MIELKTADKFPIDKLSFEQMITLLKFLNKYWGSYESYNKKADAKTNSDSFRTFNNTFLLKSTQRSREEIRPLCALLPGLR
jgi:uncharacterized protein YktA (UPF0223 family)